MKLDEARESRAIEQLMQWARTDLTARMAAGDQVHPGSLYIGIEDIDRPGGCPVCAVGSMIKQGRFQQVANPGKVSVVNASDLYRDAIEVIATRLKVDPVHVYMFASGFESPQTEFANPWRRAGSEIARWALSIQEAS